MRTTCTACGYDYPSYGTYVDEWKTAHGGLGPFAQQVDVPSECIGMDVGPILGDCLNQEINDLIRIVKSEFADKIMSDMGRLVYGRSASEANTIMWDYLRDLGERLAE